MNDEWETPQDLFDVLDKEFNFNLDVCATYKTHKCKMFFGQYHLEGFMDALQVSWVKANCWMNPPYSRGNIDKFMEKAYKESLYGATVVCLVRFDPSAKWFQKWVDDKASEVRMMARRVKFVGADYAYNFPTCIVVYRPEGTAARIPMEPDNNGYGTYYTIWDWK